jgi:2-polyprenyl-3-methyl-5-hydroxy-6-metoxy-1,4-benzoquinol methylase
MTSNTKSKQQQQQTKTKKNKKKSKTDPKLLPWIEARKRYRLSDAHVQMARSLGMNPRKLGKLANHDQESWKMPLPQYIEFLYEKRFGRERPAVVLSIEEMSKRHDEKKARKRAAKLARRQARLDAAVPESKPDGAGLASPRADTNPAIDLHVESGQETGVFPFDTRPSDPASFPVDADRAGRSRDQTDAEHAVPAPHGRTRGKKGQSRTDADTARTDVLMPVSRKAAFAAFRVLRHAHERPALFAHDTIRELWTDRHLSSRMLAFHLDGTCNVSSRTTEFVDRSASWIVSRFTLGPGLSVADFGCGPGLYTTRLAASDASVTGIDVSERSIQHARDLARGQGLAVKHVHASYLDYEPRQTFDLILMIMCDFSALSPAKRRVLLDRFVSCLKPGGQVLFDVYSLAAFAEREERATCAPGLLDGFWSPAPYFGFLNTFRYEEDKVALDRYTIVEKKRVRVFYNWLQYFDRESLGAELQGHGLEVVEFLGDVAGSGFDPTGHEFAVIARKPGDGSSSSGSATAPGTDDS